MKKRSLRISLLAGLLAVILASTMVIQVTTPTPVQAAKSSSAIQSELDALKAQKQEIDATIKELEGQLSENLTELEAMMAQKNLIDQEIFVLYKQEANINDQIAAYGILIADLQRELDDAELKLEQLGIKNKERIRAIEEGGTLSYWSVLFKANNFSDFLDRLSLVNEIAASDQRRLNEMSTLARDITASKAQLETELKALEVTKAELLETQKALEEKRAEADELLADLIATGAEYEALLEEEERKVNELDKDISQKQDEYDDAKKKEWQSQQTIMKPGDSSNVDGVTWLVPCAYTRFTSPFGERVHPVYGDVRFHYGVDLAGPSGTPIVATRAGKVVTATFSSSAGYYVTIDHQDGYSSKYLHMTHYIVSVGQYVEAGQVIGYMGSTGVSTGSHLHFSILLNGVNVNPAYYINI